MLPGRGAEVSCSGQVFSCARRDGAGGFAAEVEGVELVPRIIHLEKDQRRVACQQSCLHIVRRLSLCPCGDDSRVRQRPSISDRLRCWQSLLGNGWGVYRRQRFLSVGRYVGVCYGAVLYYSFVYFPAARKMRAKPLGVWKLEDFPVHPFVGLGVIRVVSVGDLYQSRTRPSHTACRFLFCLAPIATTFGDGRVQNHPRLQGRHVAA